MTCLHTNETTPSMVVFCCVWLLPAQALGDAVWRAWPVLLNGFCSGPEGRW